MIAEAFPKESFLGEAAGGRGTTLPASASQRNSGFAPRRRAGPVRAGRLPELTRRRAKRSHTPRRDTLPPPRQQAAATSPRLSRTLPRSRRYSAGRRPRSPSAPTAGAHPPPAERERVPAGGEGRGVRWKQAPVRIHEGNGVRGRRGNLPWLRGQGGMSPFVPGGRRACLRPSSSSTPDLMGIKIQEIKPPPQPYRTRIPPPPSGCWKGDTHRLFLALPRPSKQQRPDEALTFPGCLPGRRDGGAQRPPLRAGKAVLPPPSLQAGSSSSVPAARRSGGVSRRVPTGAAQAAPLSAGTRSC